ncbi:hypothetical protein [Rhodobacter capsulatus]|uniref:Tetratricopeptide repeat-like domain-containing protein n=1 Tax=Rhodobacter capsulatus (strain ATCC BAA-309 / NBRC 16581 / SB1003) TaxID=272942 RepID=D5AL44_RHOCB|nr:hypothetical protein [Rhodobacter capsulatus]ADE86034.1 conserved hypothetical protein [Rhodobacter capsulatus SB 1003]ETD01127.1 hypothetical protein U714_12845 [Rhodobacter capsulatus DE442]ETD75711.1 hypothetical protein U717_13005 [Rhodobacter capsulatus R121]ETE53343.1 hypothetical protein U715_13005 [Rhodobacter capsulatus Y262]MDS0927847.1 hypothetical protein [Rhodobacter capsulatus]
MDHTDSFIDEVTEEVRRDRLFAAFRKYGWIGVVAILGLVGGSAYVEWSKTQRAARAEAFGDGILSALEAENPSEALAALPVAGPQGGMRKLLTAAQAAEDGKVDLALADLRAVAGDATLPDSLRQLARLKAVLVAGAAMGAEARAAELAALAAPGAPFRLMAMEQQALAALDAGDKDGAIAKAREIMAEDGVTSGLQQRATELIVALEGDPAAK